MQSHLFLRLLAVILIVTLALVKPVPGRKLGSNSRPTGDTQSNAALEAIFYEWMLKEQHQRPPASSSSHWSSVSFNTPQKPSSKDCSDLGCCDTEDKIDVMEENLVEALDNLEWSTSELEQANDKIVDLQQKLTSTSEISSDKIKVLDNNLLEAFNNLERSRSELAQAKNTISNLENKFNSTSEISSDKIKVLDNNLLVTLENLKTSRSELTQAKETVGILEKQINTTKEIAADKKIVVDNNLLDTLDNLERSRSELAQAKKTILNLEKKLNSTIFSGFQSSNLVDCGETLFVADAMVIDVPLNASKCNQKFVTDKNHVLVFTVLGLGGNFELVQEFLLIHDVLGANSSVLLFENQTINEFSNKKLQDAIYTTGSVGEINFKKTPTSALKLKVQKAVKCPVNFGQGGTICSRFVDEISCYCIVFIATDQTSATSYCNSHGMNLLVIESEYEEKAIRSLWSSTGLRNLYITQFWTSGSDKTTKGRWIWESTGLSVGYTNWGKGEPTNRGENENCISMNFSPDYLGWYDEQCSRSFGALCEVHPY